MSDQQRYVGPLSNPFWRPGEGSEDFPGTPPIPRSAEEVTPELLNRIIQPVRPDVTIAAVEVLDAKSFGVDPDVISSANRVKLRVRYAAPTSTESALPTALLLKVARNDVKIGPIYSNETRIYNRLSRELGIGMPLCLGGAYDPDSQRYALVLGDLTAAGARFPNVLDEVSVAHVTSLLDTVAKLHARYWRTPRFQGDLAWLQTHVDGSLAQFMDHISAVYVTEEARKESFKRELMETLGMTAEEMVKGTRAVQAHQATLPQTLCHGDAHIGNTFVYPNNSVGLCDWQLTVRGYCMHDVHYLMITSLSVAARRKHERNLLAFYLERLAAYGVVDPPSFETAWKEYRRAIIWGLWVGWVGTPVACYGWQITVVNHIRLATAYRDHDTGKLVAELL